MDTRNIDRGIIRKHLSKALRIGSFGYIFNFFVDRTSKLAIHSHQVDKITCINKTGNHPNDELKRAQIHIDKLINIWQLNLDGNRFSRSSKYRFMDLPKRGRRRAFSLQYLENLFNRLT